MKMDENLGKLFNLATQDEKQTSEILPAVMPDDRQDDFDLARNTLVNLIHKNEAVITDLVDLARNSEHPRAYEVAGQLIKAQSEIAKDLLNIHKQKKELDGDSSSIRTQNNIVFAGSTSELMKLISAQRAKPIDSK